MNNISDLYMGCEQQGGFGGEFQSVLNRPGVVDTQPGGFTVVSCCIWATCVAQTTYWFVGGFWVVYKRHTVNQFQKRPSYYYFTVNMHHNP